MTRKCICTISQRRRSTPSSAASAAGGEGGCCVRHCRSLDHLIVRTGLIGLRLDLVLGAVVLFCLVVDESSGRSAAATTAGALGSSSCDGDGSGSGSGSGSGGGGEEVRRGVGAGASSSGRRSRSVGGSGSCGGEGVEHVPCVVLQGWYISRGHSSHDKCRSCDAGSGLGSGSDLGVSCSGKECDV